MVERKKIRLSEIKPGEVIPEDVDVVNDYPTIFMQEVIDNSTNQYLRACKKADIANCIAMCSLLISGIAFGIAVSLLTIVAAGL